MITVGHFEVGRACSSGSIFYDPKGNLLVFGADGALL